MILYEIYRITDTYFDKILDLIGAFTSLSVAKEKLEEHREADGEGNNYQYYKIMEVPVDNPNAAKCVLRTPAE